MPLPRGYALTPGACFAWLAEYRHVPRFAHTLTQVAFIGLDPRDPDEVWAVYLVRQATGLPKLAACGLDQFRRSCTVVPPQAWALRHVVLAAEAALPAIVDTSPQPGIYTFPTL